MRPVPLIALAFIAVVLVAWALGGCDEIDPQRPKSPSWWALIVSADGGGTVNYNRYTLAECEAARAVVRLQSAKGVCVPVPITADPSTQKPQETPHTHE